MVIAGALTLAGLVAALLVWIAPRVHPCEYAMFNPALKGKSYVCPDPAPEPDFDAG